MAICLKACLERLWKLGHGPWWQLTVCRSGHTSCPLLAGSKFLSTKLWLCPKVLLPWAELLRHPWVPLQDGWLSSEIVSHHEPLGPQLASGRCVDPEERCRLACRDRTRTYFLQLVVGHYLLYKCLTLKTTWWHHNSAVKWWPLSQVYAGGLRQDYSNSDLHAQWSVYVG